MMTKQGNEVRLTDPHRHKFADALAEYLYDDMDSWAHDASGDAECPTGWFARIGKRILRGDDHGFVWVERFHDERGAETIFNALSHLYSAWDSYVYMTDEETGVRQAGRYVDYCYGNEANNAESYPFDQWVAMGEPAGYLH